MAVIGNRSQLGMLQYDSKLTASAAGTDTSDSYKVAQGRGPVTSVSVIPEHSTIADLYGTTITLSANGVEVLKNYGLLQAQRETNDFIKKFPAYAKETTEFTWKITNASAAVIDVRVNFYYNEYKSYGQALAAKKIEQEMSEMAEKKALNQAGDYMP